VNGHAPRLAVLLVGHGPPTTGGIPSFVMRLVGDGWLGERCAIDYVNTAPDGEKLPGAFTASNLWLTAVHARTLFRRSRGADVVHLNLAAAPTLPLIRALVLTLACRLAGVPVILHAHTGMIETCVQGWLFRSIMRLELRAASLLIVVSTAAERAAAPLGGPGRVAYLPNGVDPAAFSTGPKDEGPPLVAFVGTVAERKGLIDLRDALGTLRRPDGDLPLRVVIVGDGVQEGPGSFDHIRDAYRTAGLDLVEFAGSLSHERTSALLGRAEIFCLPSHSEGFPLSVLEAMASAATVVATEVGDLPDILDHGNAGVLVPARDPGSLSRALDGLLRDAGERRRLGEAGRSRVELHYGQGRLVERLFDLYRSVARPRRTKAHADPADGSKHG
jgi:glycosyltransferase involved in cell wall biosynthesis